MKVIAKENKIVLEDLDYFNPEHIFKCGQAFRWKEEEDGSYTNVAYNKIINVKGTGDVTINSSLDDFENIWRDYFDLNRDYKSIRKELSFDETLRKALDYGKGIRILNQEPFETIITFIISANNQIPRIKKSIELISKMYGSSLGSYMGEEYYSFPGSEELSKAKAEDLREFARVGFRDKRIVETSKLISEGFIDIDSLYEIPIEDARKELMKLPGVGPKVADCVLLFAFKRSESFPVDVWIKRVMEELYLKEETKKDLIGSEGRRIFGKNAGFAQQYLFYYGRENKLGR
ncbi:DNA-3-methyladenine glycosylase family protein [Anaerosphaera multitolerans]|uniref:DNA-(apurinic or apyrimidinic site) lyase n=1 Tax=Anaerosphaera multitolerans TaxID=2487351 RepID=A0A437S8X3_9FIRM|nr:DNA glycosylase [Anaerosphaera multitolerans]RVU55565.1 8-oxoguanine DNA glycosylase [Anaerosphaera multitolerans]